MFNWRHGVGAVLTLLMGMLMGFQCHSQGLWPAQGNILAYGGAWLIGAVMGPPVIAPLLNLDNPEKTSRQEWINLLSLFIPYTLGFIIAVQFFI